jgi:hypothetical protein
MAALDVVRGVGRSPLREHMAEPGLERVARAPAVLRAVGTSAGLLLRQECCANH